MSISAGVADSAWFWLVVIGGLAAGYALPVIVGLVRHVECLAAVVILTMFPIAWPAALFLACMMPRKEPALFYPLPYYEQPSYAAGTSQYRTGAR